MAATEVHPPRRHRRWLRWVGVALLVLAAVVAVVVWRATRPPAPVSVGQVVERYRSSSPDPSAGTAGGPAPGVYVYATRGTESISAGVTHHYPARTTLTVTPSACGLTVRWDALAGRWARWQLCHDPTGWRLVHYTDAHKFLYLQDVHDYRCAGFPTVVCRTDGGVLTSQVTDEGPAVTRVGGRRLATTRLHITQHATGRSVSDGTIAVWVLPSGLPARLRITDHGSQVVLGSRVSYDESAVFALTSTRPRR